MTYVLEPASNDIWAVGPLLPLPVPKMEEEEDVPADASVARIPGWLCVPFRRFIRAFGGEEACLRSLEFPVEVPDEEDGLDDAGEGVEFLRIDLVLGAVLPLELEGGLGFGPRALPPAPIVDFELEAIADAGIWGGILGRGRPLDLPAGAPIPPAVSAAEPAVPVPTTVPVTTGL